MDQSPPPAIIEPYSGPSMDDWYLAYDITFADGAKAHGMLPVISEGSCHALAPDLPAHIQEAFPDAVTIGYKCISISIPAPDAADPRPPTHTFRPPLADKRAL